MTPEQSWEALAPDVDPTVDRFIVTIGGFTEPPSEWTGTARLNYRLRLLYSTASCMVFHRCWTDDFDELSRIMRQWASQSRQVKTVVIAYSWGCGRGVSRLAAALGKQGMCISRLLLVDPVIRPGSTLPADRVLGVLFAVKSLVALTKLGKFEVPANVKRVASFRQNNGRPFGRQLKLASNATKILNEYI